MISVVIPAHNEAVGIQRLLEEFSVLEGFELIVAEDASTDGTLELAEQFSFHDNNIRITSSSVLSGKGAAIKRGLELAAGDILGFIDADGSIHPNDFLRLVRAIDHGADLAIGSRLLSGSVITRPQPRLRRITGLFYRSLAHTLVDTDVKDFQCGCKVFRRSVWEAITIASEGFTFDTELIVKTHRKGFAIVEIPITWNNKSNSKVKIRRHAIPMLKSLFRIRAEIRKEMHP